MAGGGCAGIGGGEYAAIFYHGGVAPGFERDAGESEFDPIRDADAGEIERGGAGIEELDEIEVAGVGGNFADAEPCEKGSGGGGAVGSAGGGSGEIGDDARVCGGASGDGAGCFTGGEYLINQLAVASEERDVLGVGADAEFGLEDGITPGGDECVVRNEVGGGGVAGIEGIIGELEATEGDGAGAGIVELDEFIFERRARGGEPFVEEDVSGGSRGGGDDGISGSGGGAGELPTGGSGERVAGGEIEGDRVDGRVICKLDEVTREIRGDA